MRRVNLTDPELTFDGDDPDGFRGGMFRFGPQLGARATGSSLYELPPGQAVCPYHYEVGEEEWVLVLAGAPTLRDPDGLHQLAPMDCVFFPTGPEGAHLLRNDTSEPVRLLMYSQVSSPAVCVYPDSDKVGVYTDNSPEARGNFPRTAAVGYFEGEPGRS